MDKEELLKIAKEKYPIGTVITSLTGLTEKIISYHNLPFNKADDFWLEGEFHNLKIYDGNTWAEIISTPNKSYELW